MNNRSQFSNLVVNFWELVLIYLLGIRIINIKSVAVEVVGGKDMSTFRCEDRTTTTFFILSGGS